ncbi:MAG: hypothetical protein MUC95_05135 [Spirochaetes bacterium]|jgi:hypothetical protein|nr:hypothetical protein [Spirochaetota bacterium]
MKVIHILKRMETIDSDIKDLRKMEKALAKNKSFTTPIYMSIEKQINILLGERVKLLELQINNPPKELVELIEGPAEESKPAEEEEKEDAPAKAAKKAKPAKAAVKPAPQKKKEIDDDFDIPIMTQDIIDEKIGGIQSKQTKTSIFDKDDDADDELDDYVSDESIKLLDVALERGTLNKTELDKEKKKVKFFKDNFPSR